MPRLVLLAALLASAAHGQSVIHVDADAPPGGDGASWASAFRDLQDALAAAEAGDEVWVAEGVYKPTEGSDRTATITMMSGVALYGGFDGTDQDRDERDWEQHRSIFSGDVGVPDDHTDNAYHVVTADGVDRSAVLDGFTVEQGTGRGGDPPHNRGAGLHAAQGSPTVRNGLFRWNRIGLPVGGSKPGGGIYAEGGSPLVEDTAFEDNSANSGGGAHFEGSSPVLRRVAFRRNSASSLTFYGGSGGLVEDALLADHTSPGALRIDWSSPRFVRTTVRDNPTGGDFIGAGYLTGGASPVFEDCLFEDNTSREAAALRIEGGSPLFLRTTFRDNRASVTAGAVAADSATPVFLFCHFERNRARYGAGALNALGSGIVVIGSTFVGNVAGTASDRAGGALVVTGNPWQGHPILVASTAFVGNEADRGGAVAAYGFGEGDGRMVNVTFSGNRANAGAGGAVYAEDSGGLRIENAVLWGDEAPSVPGSEEVFVSEGAGPVVVRSLVAGGCPSGVTCEGVLDADPLFARPPWWGPDGRWGTFDDDYGDLRLTEGSPGEDYGLTALLPPDVWDLDGDGDTEEPLPLDVAGQPRVVGASVDAGAYEGAVAVSAEPGPEDGALGLSVHPNPVRGAATVVLTLPEADAATVSLYDVLGRRVAVLHEGRLPAGLHEVPLETEGLAPGVYVVRVSVVGPTRGAGGTAIAQMVTLLQ